MRDIKFRGLTINPETMKRDKKSKWVYGYYEYDSYGSCHLISVIELKPELRQYNILVDPETVSQFTGLKDKKGKDIYEGDIIKLDDVVCGITFEDGSFQMKTEENNQGKSDAIQERVKRFFVIGNIHENPELLK